MLFFRKIRNNNKSGIAIISIILTFLFLSQTSLAGNKIWFSNKPPTDNEKYVPSGMHHLSSVKGRRGQSNIIQWLREGYYPEKSKYIQIADSADFEFYLYSPAGNIAVGKFITKGKSAILSYPSKEEGYYNGYLILRNISNDTLHINIAKAEMLNHSCRNGHKNVRKKIGPNSYPETVPAEIIRKRSLDEDFHYFASSGDKIDYQFIIDGKPVKDAKLSFNTQTGWQKTLLSNENGISTFQILQDYFTHWQEIDNRKMYNYVIFGETTLAKAGKHNGISYSYIHYTTSLHDGYRPAKTMYMSMFWAFVVFLLTTGLSFFQKRSYKK